MDEFDYAEQRLATCVSVNALLLYAALCAGFGWWAWPTSYQWWGFGIMSIGAFAAAFIALFQALALIFQQWRSDRIRYAILKKGRPATANDLADDEKLDQSNVFGEEA